MSDFDQRYQNVGTQINVAVSNMLESGPARASPIIVMTVSALPEALPNFPRIDITYLRRTGSEQRRRDLAHLRRLIILGRTGLGKTREAIELLKIIESDLGEPLTVLLIRRIATVETFRLPEEVPTRNVAVLLDDLHLLATRYRQVAKSTGETAAFTDWLSAVIESLDAQAGYRLRIVATARDEPGVGDTFDLSRLAAAGFSMCQLEALDSELVSHAVELVASSFSAQVDSAAIPALVERCDGTFMSLVAYFQQQKSEGVAAITADSVRSFVGSYPVLWQSEYDTLIKPRAELHAVFKALSLLRQVGVLPLINIVADLAMELLPGMTPESCLDAISSASSWLTVERVSFTGNEGALVRCPDAYLQVPAETQDERDRKTLAAVLFRYTFDRGLNSLIYSTQERSITEALRQLSDEVTPLLIDFIRGVETDVSLTGVALLLGQWRARNAVPALIERIHSLTDRPSTLELRQELAVCLGFVGHPDSLPVIFDVLHKTPDGTIKGDIILNLPLFQDRLSLELILDEISGWDAWDRGLLADSCLESPAIPDTQTEEEVEEIRYLEANRRARDVSDLRPHLEQLVSTQNKRLRFRGYLAACLLGLPALDIVERGLHDDESALRGASLMMLSRYKSARDLGDDAQLLHGDLGTYDGRTLQTLAADLTQRTNEERVARFKELSAVPVDSDGADSDGAELVPAHLVPRRLPVPQDLPQDPPVEWSTRYGSLEESRVLLDCLHSDIETLRVPAAVGLARLGLATKPVVKALYSLQERRGSYVLASLSECYLALAQLAQQSPQMAQILPALAGFGGYSLLSALETFPVTDDALRDSLGSSLESLIPEADWMTIEHVVKAFISVGGVIDAVNRTALMQRLADTLTNLSKARFIGDVSMGFGMAETVVVTELDVGALLWDHMQLTRPRPMRNLREGMPVNDVILWLVGEVGLPPDPWLRWLSQGLSRGYAASCIASTIRLKKASPDAIRLLRSILDGSLPVASSWMLGDPAVGAALALTAVGAEHTEALKALAQGPARHISGQLVESALGERGDLAEFFVGKFTSAAPSRADWDLEILHAIGPAGHYDSGVIDYLVRRFESAVEPGRRASSVAALLALGACDVGQRRGVGASSNRVDGWRFDTLGSSTDIRWKRRRAADRAANRPPDGQEERRHSGSGIRREKHPALARSAPRHGLTTSRGRAGGHLPCQGDLVLHISRKGLSSVNTFFDQRGQHVERQANIVGNLTHLDFGAVTDRASFIDHLERLKAEVVRAASVGEIEAATAAEADDEVAKAIEAANDPGAGRADKIEGHLSRAKAVIAAATSATGLITALVGAIDAVKNIF